MIVERREGLRDERYPGRCVKRGLIDVMSAREHGRWVVVIARISGEGDQEYTNP